MVVRTRLRAFVRYLALYCAAGGVIAYFVFHAMNGDHGIVASRHFDQQKAELSTELAELQTQRQALEHRIALLKADGLDPDMLDEKAREMVGFVHPNEVVVMSGPPAGSPAAN